MTSRIETLRQDFDHSFAAPPAAEAVKPVALLTLQLAGEPFALRLRDVRGLFADKAVTALPSELRELVGVAGFRGGVVPVYDLRALLGLSTAEKARWLVLVTTGSDTQIALAFAQFDGHVRVDPGAIAVGEGDLREVVRTEGATRPIIDVGSLLASISKRARVSQRER